MAADVAPEAHVVAVEHVLPDQRQVLSPVTVLKHTLAFLKELVVVMAAPGVNRAYASMVAQVGGEIAWAHVTMPPTTALEMGAVLAIVHGRFVLVMTVFLQMYSAWNSVVSVTPVSASQATCVHVKQTQVVAGAHVPVAL